MKKILILCCTLAVLFSGCSKDEPLPSTTPVNGHLTLHIKTPGTLHTVISESDKYEITSLTLTGNLNGTDIRLIREMVGRDEKDNLTDGKLTALDLSGANIVEGGEVYYYYRYSGVNTAYYTSTNQIGAFMFYECNDLTAIKIPDSATSIDAFAFYFCEGLTAATIGNSVTSIEFCAFAGCTGLKEIYSQNPVPPRCYTSSTFEEVVKTSCIVYVPVGSLQAYQAAGYWNMFQNIVEKEMP